MDEEKLVSSLKEAFVPMFERIETRFDNMETRMDRMETDIKVMKEDINDIKDEIVVMKDRLDNVETDVRIIKIDIENHILPSIQVLKEEGYMGRVEKDNELNERVDDIEQDVIALKVAVFAKKKQKKITK